MNKKLILAVAMVATACTAVMAGPHHDRRWHGGHGGHPPAHHVYHGGHRSMWGHGGRNFWPGFVGGVVGGVVGSVITAPCYAQPAPVVYATTVQQPVYVQPTPVVTTAPANVYPNPPVYTPREGIVVQSTSGGYSTTVTQSGYYTKVTTVTPTTRVWVGGHYENGVYIPGHYAQ